MEVLVHRPTGLTLIYMVSEMVDKGRGATGGDWRRVEMDLTKIHCCLHTSPQTLISEHNYDIDYGRPFALRFGQQRNGIGRERGCK